MRRCSARVAVVACVGALMFPALLFLAAENKSWPIEDFPVLTPWHRDTQVWLTVDFVKSEIKVGLFLSEVRAQEIATRLRQHAHVGVVSSKLQEIIEKGIAEALSGSCGRLRIVHERATVASWQDLFQRLPPLASQLVLRRLQNWETLGLSDFLEDWPWQFVKATQSLADGVTVVLTVVDPPGLEALCDALEGLPFSMVSLTMAGEGAVMSAHCVPGWADGNASTSIENSASP